MCPILANPTDDEGRIEEESMRSLHHAAFDQYFLYLRPDYVIEVRADFLREHDGQTLIHATQALHGSRMILPTVGAVWPDPALVEIRYERFSR